MDAAQLGLAIIPPSLAILVEALNPINERALNKSALVDLETVRTEVPHLLFPTVDQAQTLAAAAVEISGLAPTLVASVTSGFAVIHELPEPFWPAIVYSLAFLGVGLFLIWLLNGTTFRKIGETKINIGFVFSLKGGFRLDERSVTESGWTRQEIVRTVIYGANFTLILASAIVFCFLHWPLIVWLPILKRFPQYLSVILAFLLGLVAGALALGILRHYRSRRNSCRTVSVPVGAGPESQHPNANK
jgi:hypothetical protein